MNRDLFYDSKAADTMVRALTTGNVVIVDRDRPTVAVGVNLPGHTARSCLDDMLAGIRSMRMSRRPVRVVLGMLLACLVGVLPTGLLYGVLGIVAEAQSRFDREFYLYRLHESFRTDPPVSADAYWSALVRRADAGPVDGGEVTR